MLLNRPQPLGVLPPPAGWLVLPADALADEAGASVRDRLVSGTMPQHWPPALEFVRVAAEGATDRAATLVNPWLGPEHAYNHFVLTGEPSSLAGAREGAEAAGDVDLAALAEVAAFCLGLEARLPDPCDLTGEVAAHVLAARAAAHLEHGDAQSSLEALVAARAAARETSPVQAALLHGQQAVLQHQLDGADEDVVAAYREAVDVLRGLDAVEPATGELALGMGTALQEIAAATGRHGRLVDAVRCYHLALRLLRRDVQPERYAFAHSNLALAYLAMPVSDAKDTLRRRIAVQSLREALTYYGRDTHPREWACVTLDLANTLQYLPSPHSVDNLVEAVARYDELIEVWPESSDPLGHARVLANQGTALSRLGVHDRARLRLTAARDLFERYGEGSAVATVDQALAEVDAALDGAPSRAGVGAREG